MALLQCGFYSEVLGLSVSMNAIVPQSRDRVRHPVLYLLHGLSDDHSVWLRRTSIERYADRYGLAVVMPEVHRSFYADLSPYRRYGTFVGEELPAIAESLLPIADDRDGRFVAGLSMGGYGAFKLALRHPERFAFAASLSGAMDVGRIGAFMGGEADELFGGRPTEGTDDDLFALAERLAASPDAPRPALYQCCGTEDFLLDDNRRFAAHAQGLGLALDYEEESGDHTWDYWDMAIDRVIRRLPLHSPNKVP